MTMYRLIACVLCAVIAIGTAGCPPSKRGDLIDRMVEKFGGLTASYDGTEKSSDPMTTFNSGVKAFEEKQYQRAQLLFAQFARANPNEKQVPEALFYQGECFYYQNVPLQAIRYYEEVINRFPSSSKYVPSLFRKGSVQQNIGKREEAKKIFALITRKYPHSPYAAKARMEILEEDTESAPVDLIAGDDLKSEKLRDDNTPPTIIISSYDTSRAIRISRKHKTATIRGLAEDESGIVEVVVDNKEADVDAEGNFNADVYLGVGENRIVVSAMDRYRNRATKTFTIIREGASPSPEHSAPTPSLGHYHALVIGNNTYKYLRPLETASTDAEDIAEILRRQYGFDTKLLIDAKRNDILKSINHYRRILKDNDKFLVYYAGHGEYDQVADKAYWLPVDARKGDDTNWIIVDTITSNIKRISSRHILIVADSCYSGTLTRGNVTKLTSGRERQRYLNKMLTKKSRTLLSSGGNEPVSDMGGHGHSVFAEVFIQALRQIEDETFSAEELFYQHIKERVAGKATQIPEYNIIRNSGHDGGDFVFKRIAGQ